MLDVTDHAEVVALLRSRSRPPAGWAAVLESAAGVGTDPSADSSPQPSLFDADGSAPLTGREHARATEDLREWEAAGIRLVTVLDAGYPPNLLAAHDRPPFVFVRGALRPRDDARSVAVIGTRTPTALAQRHADAVARALVGARFTVISGLAAGIDTVAHRAALDASGRTVAVLGTGVGRCYPSENHDLQERIADQGAVLSQFWPETRPTRRTFPLRNAVMSGIALATVIVEASERSGTRIQARAAISQGRPVVLCPPVMRQDWARELANLPGVHTAADAADVVAIVARLTEAPTLVA